MRAPEVHGSEKKFEIYWKHDDTKKTHETHTALTTSDAHILNEEHLRQKEPYFMQ